MKSLGAGHIEEWWRLAGGALACVDMQACACMGVVGANSLRLTVTGWSEQYEDVKAWRAGAHLCKGGLCRGEQAGNIAPGVGAAQQPPTLLRLWEVTRSHTTSSESSA